MKLLTIVGARPQFVKASVVSRAISDINRSDGLNILETILHTGQHFDANMSDAFFDQLNIPVPKINLGIHSSSHSTMTAQMMMGIENAIEKEMPDVLLVYGDTNSTLAGALVASKMSIPIAHVEAGLRSFNRQMPEEINRVLTDHLAKHLYCPTITAVKNLCDEGIVEGVFQTGDVMLDAFEFATQHLSGTSSLLNTLVKNPKAFVVATVHRPSNTDNSNILKQILSSLNEIADNFNVVFPLHPRTKAMIENFDLQHMLKNLIVCEPVNYFEMVSLLNHCEFVITDSGGLQKEAYFAKKPCITLRNETEWVETLESKCNQLVGNALDTMSSALSSMSESSHWKAHYGKGDAGAEIVRALRKIT